jgi:hypothetical protein
MSKKQRQNTDSENSDSSISKSGRKSIHLKDVIQDEDTGDNFLEKLRFLVMKGLFCALFGLIVMGLGLLAGNLIAYHFGYKLQDTLFITGMVLTILGIFASMKGNPTSINISGMGMKNINALNYRELETVRLERERTNYYHNFVKHAVVKFAVSGLTIILGGIFTVFVSILFY